jgi:hypothetical protein
LAVQRCASGVDAIVTTVLPLVPGVRGVDINALKCVAGEDDCLPFSMYRTEV